MAQLRADPLEPSLRLHTLTLQITEHEISLLDIGSHDEVYG